MHLKKHFHCKELSSYLLDKYLIQIRIKLTFMKLYSFTIFIA